MAMTRPMIPLGDLVAAVFDEAERQCSNPADVSRLASRILEYMLRGTRMALTPLDGQAAPRRSSCSKLA